MNKKYYFRNKTAITVILSIFLVLALTPACSSGVRDRESIRERFSKRLEERKQGRLKREKPASAKCDGSIPRIHTGYGANGSFDMEMQTLKNPLWSKEKVTVIFPKGSNKKNPVIFFSHAYGAKDWNFSYDDFISHIVSKGYIVVYSPYQTLRADFNERYATIWKGFELAAAQFKERMDLGRVGFVGHSFGAGATPAMANKGLLEKNWGKNGAFMYILAPWYSFQMTPEKFNQFPKHTVLIVQVYDKDETNDHRMAIDIYRNIKLPEENKHFQMIKSESINGCELIADHITPSRNPSMALRQYAVFRPFDAVSDYTFNGNSNGKHFLSSINSSSRNIEYQPVQLVKNPKPEYPEKNYIFPWDNKKNPRRSL